MADSLVVGGVALLVVADRPREARPEPIGTRGRSLSGRDAGHIRGELREFPFTAYEVPESRWIALRAASPLGSLVLCSGTLLPGPGYYHVRRSAAVRRDRLRAITYYTPRLVLRGPFANGGA